MEKPIIATNIDGLLLEHETFIEPHKAWFDRAIEKTGDTSLEKWKGNPEYFKGVNKAMEQIMSEATEEERTAQARKWYQEGVVEYIKAHPKMVKKEISEKLKSLKNKYQLILVTSNTKDYIDDIIKAANLEEIYDAVIASKTEKEPNKKELIGGLIEKYGKPSYYLTGKVDEKITDKFEELKVKVIGVDEIDKIK